MFELQSAWNPWELFRNAWLFMLYFAVFAYAYCRRGLEEQSGWLMRQTALDTELSVLLRNNISNMSYVSYSPLLPKGHPGQYSNPSCFSAFVNQTINSNNNNK